MKHESYKKIDDCSVCKKAYIVPACYGAEKLMYCTYEPTERPRCMELGSGEDLSHTDSRYDDALDKWCDWSCEREVNDGMICDEFVNKPEDLPSSLDLFKSDD
jgi:hypothetical protein